jgi:predicted nucleotidyltransferase component of viral defense system
MKNNIERLLEEYNPQSKNEYKNAIQEIMQEIALLGLWRAKFFEHAAFYGGTSLRILYGLDRFSEDLDFSLLKTDLEFDLKPFLKSIEEELMISGLNPTINLKVKSPADSIRSAFLKVGTLETFIQVGLDETLKRGTQSNELIKIKLEVDINPPLGFSTEIKHLTSPIPFSVRSYVPEDLFAGKMHAVLCRPYKVRVKGRDWYDLIWYVKKGFSLNLSHLEIRMRQSGHYEKKEALTPDAFKVMLAEKIKGLNFKAAKEDIYRFIQNPRDVDGWEEDFFMSLLSKIRFSERG